MTLTVRVPEVIEQALWAAARRQLPAEVLGGAALTSAVIDRSRRYTTERDRLDAPMRPDADLAARALFFTVADAGKLGVPLAELVAGRAPAGFLDGDLRVLDLGAGCGAMTLGLCAFLAERAYRGRLTVTLVDHDARALAIAAAAVATVAQALALPCAVTTQVADVTEPRTDGPYELVVAGTVVNELAGAGAALVAAMVDVLTPGGVAIVVEPALRMTSRALHAIRDQLIVDGRAAVLAPCTRRAAPCPALADERDWCHDHRPAELPPRTRQLATVTGLRDGDAKLAFLALARPGAAPPPPPAWRVIDDPRGQKGKHELTACGAPGWVPVRLLRRHRSLDNRGFERCRRGDLLAIEPPPAPDATPADLTSTTRVTPWPR
ncbi:MAG: small ribosomal subunit Rsm22 family protein [Kofleriaceae bacterium]